MPLLTSEGSTTLTTNYTNYVSILKTRNTEAVVNVSLIIRNSHATDAIDWKVLISNDLEGISTSFAEEKSEASLSALTLAKHVLSGPFIWIDVQIKSIDEDSPQATVWQVAAG